MIRHVKCIGENMEVADRGTYEFSNSKFFFHESDN